MSDDVTAGPAGFAKAWDDSTAKSRPAPGPQQMADQRLLVGRLGCVAEEPADEDEPDAGEYLACQDHDHDAQDHQAVGHHRAYPRGDARGPQEAVGDPPEEGTQDATSVQGKAGDEVEDADRAIGDGQVSGGERYRLVDR